MAPPHGVDGRAASSALTMIRACCHVQGRAGVRNLAGREARVVDLWTSPELRTSRTPADGLWNRYGRMAERARRASRTLALIERWSNDGRMAGGAARGSGQGVAGGVFELYSI